MAKQHQEEDCVRAFKSGSKLMAEQLISRIPPTSVCTITTTFILPGLTIVPYSMVTLLHLAAYWGWENIVTALVSKYYCATNSKDNSGRIPLHYAAYNGHLVVVRYLTTELQCDPMEKDNYGWTALHFACDNGHLDIAQYLIREERCNPSCENRYGNTPLHYACSQGNLDIAQYIIKEEHCNPSCEDNDGETPLHYACRNGHLKIAQYLIGEEHCCSSCESNDSWTPLHFACNNGHLSIAQYLIKVEHCNTTCRSNDGGTPLHYACRDGQLHVAQYLIKDEHCNPSCENNDGYVPLHYACREGHLKIAEYLIREEHCNPSCESNDGWTPLHFGCRYNHANIVRCLLSTGRVNPLTKNKYGHTAMSFASGNYDIIKLFQPFEECRTAFPVHTFTKLILTGDSGAGKTTTAKHLAYLASTANTDLPVAVDSVANVECYTAGIIPHHIQSEQLGNFVVYDFAGQQEYYSSHAAVLEQVMRRSPAMFVCMIDLSKNNESICQSLHYWLSFINNACSAAEGRSHLLIMGSHADLVAPSVEEKSLLLQTIIDARRVKRQEYIGCIAMDCRKINTEASRRLLSILANSQKIIAASQPVIHYYSHVVYAFLHTKVNVVGCTLHDLVSAIAKEGSSSLPSDQTVLIEILTVLSDRGLILFIHHHHSSWVVVKTEVLLNEINGTLFAPCRFKEHCDFLASNTGIVTTSCLLTVFPHYNTDMLVGFLQSLNFCRPVEPSVLQNTNLQTTPSHSLARLLFFPSLIQSDRPDSLVQQEAFNFGWCLRCEDSNEFFSSRFLHILLLSVAYKFPLASQGLNRMCRVWRNGIFWRNYDDITTVIELLDNNRCVLLAMSCDDSTPIEHAEVRSSIISLVHGLQQQHCPHLNVHEFLISPDLIQQYPLDNLPESDLFNIHHVAQCVLLRKSVVPSYKDSSGRLPVQSLPFEPYHQLSSSSVCQLLNPVMVDQPVPISLLHEVRKLCQHSKMSSVVYKELREYLDNLSLFAGRNPLVSSSCTVAFDSKNVSLMYRKWLSSKRRTFQVTHLLLVIPIVPLLSVSHITHIM